MQTRQMIILGAAAALVITSYLFMTTLSDPGEGRPKHAAPAVKPYVDVQKVSYSDIPTELEYFGRVASAHEVQLVSEVPGRLMPGNVRLKEGMNFGSGTLLFRVDDTEARLSLQATKSTFMKTLAEILPDLKIDFPGRFEIWQTYFARIHTDRDLPELPEAMSQREKTFLAGKGILSAYYDIRSQEERLRKYSQYAPFRGSVTEVSQEPGSVVNSGSVIARIIRTDDNEVTVPVPLEDIDLVNRGAAARILAEDGSREWKGEVVRISESVDAETQSVNVYVRVNSGQEDRLLPGQYLKVVFPGKVVRQAMVIPRSTLIDRQNVFVVRDSVLKIQQVTVSKLNPSTAVIYGLKEGESLVMDPPVSAEEGMEIKIRVAQ